MFSQALEELVHRSGADFAIFCDYEGESIAFSSRALPAFDVRLAGAQLGPIVFFLQRSIESRQEPPIVSLSCTAEHHRLLLEGLPGGYYLLLAIPGTALEGPARYALRETAERFRAEI